MGKLVLVTGGLGWIGGLIIPKLAEWGWRCNPYDLENGQDIFDKNLLEKTMRGYDAVIHLAGIHGPIFGKKDEEYKHNNYEGSKTVVDIAYKVGIKRLIFVSSNDVYGYSVGIVPKYPITDKTPIPKELHSYAKYKLKTETYYKKMAKKYEMTIVSLRIGGVDAGLSQPWHLKAVNMAKALDGALKVKIKGFEWFNIADADCQIDIGKAKRLLNYEGG